MSTPAWGAQIAVSDINSATGTSYNAQKGLNWLSSNARTTLNTASGFTDMNNAHAKDYYANNTFGNCNNGNQVHCNCNCGNKNCTNCTNCNAINCTNCDSQNYLQPNCNCACTYNCNVNSTSFNCDCDCFACW